jgi:hypothetical protein
VERISQQVVCFLPPPYPLQVRKSQKSFWVSVTQLLFEKSQWEIMKENTTVLLMIFKSNVLQICIHLDITR